MKSYSLDKQVFRQDNVQVIKKIEAELAKAKRAGTDIRLDRIIACQLISFKEVSTIGSLLKVRNCLDGEIESYYTDTQLAESIFAYHGTDATVWLVNVVVNEGMEMISYVIDHSQEMERILQQNKRIMAEGLTKDSSNIEDN